MIRQSQNYFAAAVSAALVNAAAITAFVLFTILSSVHGFGLRSVLDAVDSIGSPSQSSASPGPAGGTLSGPLIRDVGSGSARLVPNPGSSSGSPSSGLAGSNRGINQSAASANGGSVPGPSGSGGGTSSAPGGSGGPVAGGPTLPSPSTGGPGSVNVPNTVNNAVGSATSNVQSAGTGLTNTANGLLGTNPLSGGNGGRSAPTSAPGSGSVSGAVNGATDAVKNTGLTLPGLG